MKDTDIEVVEFEKKKKKRFSFKRFFAYMGVYVLLSFCFGFVIVMCTDTTSSNSLPTLDLEEEEPSAFASLVNNLMAMNDFSTDISLDLSSDNNSSVAINGNLKIVLYEGYTGAEVDANLNFNVNNESFKVNLLYKNDEIYFSLNDYHYMFKASSFISGAGLILQTFGVELGGLDELLANFDMSILNDLESMLSEQVYEEYKLLTLKISEDIEVKIQTDLNYNISEIYLENLNLENSKLSASLTLKDVNLGQTVEVPNLNFVDITESASLIQVLTNTFKENNIKLDLNLKGEKNFNASLILDKSKHLKAQILTKILNRNIMLSYQNQTVFASFDNLKFKAEISDFEEYLNAVNKFIDFDLSSLSTLIDSSSLTELLKAVLTIDEISKIDDEIVIVINENKISLNIKDDKLNSISFSVDGNEVEISVSYGETLKELEEESYLNAKNFLDFVDPILNTINKTNFAGTIEAKYKNEKLTISYAINIENSLKAKFETSYLGVNLSVIILDNTIYLDVNGIKIKASFKDLSSLIENLSKVVETEITDVKLEDILTSQKLIQDFAFILNGIYLKAFDAEIMLSHNGKTLSCAEVLYKDIAVKISLDTVDNNALNINLTEGYIDYKNVEELVKNTLDFISSKNYNFDINLKYNNLTIYGYLGLINNEINADLTVNFQDLNIFVKIVENVIYAEFNGLKIKCSLTEIDKIISFIEEEFNLSLTDLKDNISGLKEEISKENIEEIIKKLIINYTENSLSFNFENLNLIINLKENKFNNLNINYKELNANFNLVSNKEVVIPNGNYIDIVELLPLLSATKHTLENGYVSGDIILNFTMFEERNTVKLNYMVSFKEEILAYFNTTFKGVNIEIYYINQTFYLNLAGLKVYIKTSDINALIAYINSTFNLNLSLDLPELNLSSINLDLIESVDANSTSTKVILKNGYRLEVDFNEYINKVNLIASNFDIELNCKDFSNVIFENIDTNSYSSYTKLTDLITKVLNTFKEKNFNISIESTIFNNGKAENLNINLIFSMQSEFALYGNVRVGEEFIEIYFQNSMLYIKYRELKLAVSLSSLKEILSLALQIVGVDPTSIPFLDSIGEDINLDNIQNLIPEIDFGNPLNLLELVDSMSMDGNAFKLNLKGEKISDIQKNMNIMLFVGESGLESVELNNIFTSSSTYFNAVILKNAFTEVPSLTDVDTFIDISNSSKLLKAILNTTSLNDFQIKGTINVVASVIGIDINMDIPMLVNVKLIDGKPVIYASFDIPVIGSNVPGFTKINVNNDVPYERGDTSVKSRKLEIYYADNYVYFYRKDVVNQTVFASRTYEKKLKLALEELMSDPMGYILQYGFGFSEDIMAEINKAIEKSLNRETPIDYSKILINYINNDAFQTIVINLAELANNEMLDSAILNFYTTLINNKDYFSKLCFDIYMPIASAFTLNLKTEDLSLVNIGEKVDINNINKFISEYPYKENQMYEASDSDWGLASEKKYTITFVTEYQTAPSIIEASVNSNIVILNLENFVNDDSVTKKSYYFEGWYTSEDYKEQFTSNIMPRGDLTLYAKWSVVTEYYRTLTLLGGLDGKVEITKLEGEYIELPTFTYKQETEGDVTTTYSFQGWQTEDGTIFSSSAMPTENKTLSAVWKVEKIEITKELSIYDEDELIYSARIKSGESIILPEHEKLKIDTKYYLDNEYLYEYEISVMPDENLKLFVRNKYTLNVISEYGEVLNTIISVYQGESYTLTSQSSYVYDNGDIRIDYTFNGYISSLDINYIMPNENMTITADWVVLEREYFTVSFDTRWYIPIGWVSEGILVSAPTEVKSVKVLQGEDLDLTQFVSITQRKYTRISKTYTWKTESWGLEPFSDISTKSGVTKLENVQSDITLYACWHKQ